MGEVKITAEQYRSKKKRFKIAKLVLLILLICLAFLYAAFALVYNNYGFTITLDRNLYYDNNVIIYDDKNYKTYRQKISVATIDYFDNISYKWLPNDLNDYDGSHNGQNYIAYSFYIENMGNDSVNYWAEIDVEDSVKGLKDAVRIMVYYDGVPTTYAAPRYDGTNENGTELFYDDNIVMLQGVEEFKPTEIHKYTVVIWLEGNDDDCNDSILGGELRISMRFNSDKFVGGNDEKEE